MGLLRRSNDWLKLIAVLTATVVLAGLVRGHVEAINGSRFHRWGWWNPPIAAWRLYPAMLAALVPFLLGQQIFTRRGRALPAIVLVMLSALLLQIVAVGMHSSTRFDPGRIATIVMHPVTTSYFTDSLNLQLSAPLGEWLREYPRYMPELGLHSRIKPPGPILYWFAFQQLFAEHGTAALVGGIVLGIIACFTVPAVHGLARVVTRGDGRAAFWAASYMGLMPSVLLFFPTFDQCYALFACGMIGFWILAVRTRRPVWAVACGLVLSGAIFFSYTMLVLGAFIALYGVISNWRAEDRQRAAQWLFLQSSLVLGTVAAMYTLFWLLTGFDAIETFRVAWANQKQWEATFAIPRPHPHTVPSDLQDLLLGSGWISAILVLYWLLSLRKTDPQVRWILLLGLAQPLITAATGLVQAETARVWGFMQPLVLIPIGIELSRWGHWPRVIVYVCLWAVVVVMAQNLIFLW